MLNQKEIVILELLLQNAYEYLTSQDIAPHIGVSDKTTRKYIKQLDEAIDDDLAQIKSVSGHGYQLVVQNEQAFQTFYRNNVASNQLTNDINCIEEPKDRQYFILHHLFFENDAICLDDLIEELYVSESTLLNDIAEINKRLKPFKLMLKTSKKTGVTIVGDEQNKRHFIINYFLIDRYQDNLKSFEEISSILTNIRLEEILLIVLDEYRNANLTLNDAIIFNIVIHIALALKRVENGHHIQFHMRPDDVTSNKETQTAKNIIRRLKKSTGVILPDEEVYNIALHLKNKQSNRNLLKLQNTSESELHSQIIEGLKSLEQKIPISYSEDTILIEGLTAHFTPFLLRLNNGSGIKNPLLEEIKEKHWMLFNQTKLMFSNMNVLENKEVSDDEWAYIALHVIAAHERQMNEKRLHTLVICATGIGSSQMLKMRLENELGSKLIIDDVISYFEITDEKLKGIDLVVSSIDLSNIVFTVPIVSVSVLLNDADIKAINQVISSSNSIYKEERRTALNKSIDIKEIIDQYFDPNLFILSHDIATREEAIDALINQSYEVDSSINKFFLKNQLTLREQFSSVVFAKDVAIPHPIEGVSNKAKVAILVTPKGIDWDAYSNQVRLTLLMIPDRFEKHHMEKVSWAILPILEDQNSIDALVNTTSYKGFTDKLIEILS